MWAYFFEVFARDLLLLLSMRYEASADRPSQKGEKKSSFHLVRFELDLNEELSFTCMDSEIAMNSRHRQSHSNEWRKWRAPCIDEVASEGGRSQASGCPSHGNM